MRASLQCNKQFRSFNKSGLSLVVSLVFTIWWWLFYLNCFCLQANILSITISNQFFGSNYTCRCGVSEGMQNQIFMLLKCLLANENIEWLIFAIRHIYLVWLNLMVFAFSIFGSLCRTFFIHFSLFLLFNGAYNYIINMTFLLNL